jgi:glycosyltransferase involved in cell wall biosynthesis
MKILFVIRELRVGGAQRQLCLLANSLAARGHEPVIAVFYGGGTLEADLHEGVRLVSLEKRQRWDVLPFVHRMLKLIAHERPDVVHGYMSGGNLCATLARISWRTAKIVWGMRASEFDPNSGDMVSRIVDRIEAKLSYVPDRIIVNSAAGMRYCNKIGFRRKSLVLVPNAIDAHKYYVEPAAGQRVRLEWGISASDTLIGLVGRLDPMKGHAVFLAAAAQLKASHRKLRFVCLGNGSQQYLGDMKSLALRLGLNDDLLWLDARTDMRAVYNAIDVMCSSSVYGEGFPNVIGEAMACGRRCVVTDVGDSAFVVGNTQVVVPHNDPAALASGIIEQLAHTSSSNNEARQRIVDSFSVTRLTDTTESILLDLLQADHEVSDPPMRTAGHSKHTPDEAAKRA